MGGDVCPSALGPHKKGDGWGTFHRWFLPPFLTPSVLSFITFLSLPSLSSHLLARISKVWYSSQFIWSNCKEVDLLSQAKFLCVFQHLNSWHQSPTGLFYLVAKATPAIKNLVGV